MGRDARAAARVAGCLRVYASVLEALLLGLSARTGVLWGDSATDAGQDGWAWDELESLILAQNERWRHA